MKLCCHQFNVLLIQANYGKNTLQDNKPLTSFMCPIKMKKEYIYKSIVNKCKAENCFETSALAFSVLDTVVMFLPAHGTLKTGHNGGKKA